MLVHLWWLVSDSTNAFYAVTSSWFFSLGFFLGYYHRHKCVTCWRFTHHPHKVNGTHHQTCHKHATASHHAKIQADHQEKYPDQHKFLKTK